MMLGGCLFVWAHANQFWVCGWMMNMEDEAVQAARERLTSEDPRMRVHALYLLSEREDRESLPTIVALLHDEDHRVRMAALHIVGKLRSVEALPDVLSLLQDRESVV